MTALKRTPVRREQLPECFGKAKLNVDCVELCEIWAACVRASKIPRVIRIVK